MKLITLEEESPVFNPEARMIKEFNTIIVRDKGSKGDATGRFKKLATKELAYVHFMSHYNSEFIASGSEDERLERLKRHLNLSEDWKPDAVIELACITYKELISTPSSDSLVEARESLFSANKILKILRKKMEKQLQDLDSQLTGITDEEAEKLTEKLLLSTTSLYDRIIKIAEKMPATLEIINKLEERVKKEMQQEQKGKKNSIINEWEQ